MEPLTLVMSRKQCRIIVEALERADRRFVGMEEDHDALKDLLEDVRTLYNEGIET